MARELVWLEDRNFAAWGCAECNWLLANPGTELSEKPPTHVKKDFNEHACAMFPLPKKCTAVATLPLPSALRSLGGLGA